MFLFYNFRYCGHVRYLMQTKRKEPDEKRKYGVLNFDIEEPEEEKPPVERPQLKRPSIMTGPLLPKRSK